MNEIRLVLLAIVIAFVYPSAICQKSATRKKSSVKKEVVTPAQVAALIDSVAPDFITAYLAQDTVAVKAHPVIATILKVQPKDFDRFGLSKLYEDTIVARSEREDADGLISVCATALISGDEDLAPMACSGLAQAMAQIGDTEGLEKALRRYELLSEASDGNPYKEEIDKMRVDYDDVLHPRTFEDYVRGTWVCVDYCMKRNPQFPYIIFDINSLKHNQGLTLRNIPGETSDLESKSLSALLQSQYIGGEDGFIQAAFGSEQLSRGNDALAQSGFQATRNFRADMRAAISTSRASFGKKMAVTVVSETTAGFLDALLMASAQSYKQVAALNLSLSYVSPQVMNAHAEFYNYRVNVNQMNRDPKPIFDKDVTFVKWEPEDGIYFVDSKRKVYSVTPLSQLDLSEYDKIMYDYSWKRTKYWLPTTACIVGGIGVMVGGISLMSADKKDANGNIVYNKYGNPEIKNLGLGITMMFVGEFTAILGPLGIGQYRFSKRDKALRELNNRQQRKLANKQVTLNWSPNYDPIVNSCGLSASITF